MTERVNECTERELVLAEWFLLYTDDEDDDEDTRAEVGVRRDESREKYLAQLEPVELSRCFFTDEVVSYPVDTVSLDGPFWDVRNPARTMPPESPATLVGLSGAVQLTGDAADIPYFPFLARPGPEVPFVLPGVLDREGLVAVISAVLIGPHAGFPIAYFAEPGTDLEGVPAIDEWGSDRAFRRNPTRGWVWDSSTTPEDAYDYDLAPWIEQGKLRWIEPYDRSLVVRSGVDGCPYIDQIGHREVTRIEDLEVWWPSNAPADEGDDGA